MDEGQQPGEGCVLAPPPGQEQRRCVVCAAWNRPILHLRRVSHAALHPRVFGLVLLILKRFDFPLASGGEDPVQAVQREDVMSPHHHLRHVTATAAIVTIAACSLTRSATAQENNQQLRRARSLDVSITELMEQAVARSPTFKRLVATVEASNGIIYIEAGLCPGRVLACLPSWMVSSGGNRFMRIVVDRQRLDSDELMVGAIAHELQHAIEALSDRFVTDGNKMFFFYRRYAPTAKEQVETMDAIQAGMAAEDEWRRSARRN